MESSIIPSIPVPIENKQLPPPSNVMAFGVPVFEAHKGMQALCTYNSYLTNKFLYKIVKSL